MKLANITYSGELALLKLINEQNELNLQPGQLRFGVPTTTTENGRNTKVQATATELLEQQGRHTFYYDRLDITEALKEMYGDERVVLDVFGGYDAAKAADALNIEYSLSLTPDDLSGFNPNPELAIYMSTVIMPSNSLIYTGELLVDVYDVDWAKTRVTDLGLRKTTNNHLRYVKV